MLRILRQLTPQEMRLVADRCGARFGAAPEEVIRCLSRLCGATVLGLFPASSDDVLLDHVGRRLGMQPLNGGPRAVVARERAILAGYLRHAWETAPPERKRAVLRTALTAWDHPSVPRPEVPPEVPEPLLATSLETLLHHSTGCRALAVALETYSLPLPAIGGVLGPLGIPICGGSQGHQALYEVLVILWRARARILRERRTQRAELERQLRQVDSLVAVRRRNLGAVRQPWSRNPRSGLCVAAGAAVSLGVHAALAAAAPVVLVPALVVGAAGLAWSAAAGALGRRNATDPRIFQMQAQGQQVRSQLLLVDREILTLETE